LISLFGCEAISSLCSQSVPFFAGPISDPSLFSPFNVYRFLPRPFSSPFGGLPEHGARSEWAGRSSAARRRRRRVSVFAPTMLFVEFSLKLELRLPSSSRCSVDLLAIPLFPGEVFLSTSSSVKSRPFIHAFFATRVATLCHAELAWEFEVLFARYHSSSSR